MRLEHLILALFVPTALLVGTGVDSCGPDILADPSFDLWCGQELCGWEVEEGQVEKVPTWHRSDYGAALVGDEVAISQLALLTEEEVDCILFTLQAEADEGVTISLEMDFEDDGAVEYDHPVPAEDWQVLSYAITPPAAFDSVRFRVRKVGGGDAVLAQIRAQEEARETCTAEPLELAR